jgi:hypothetical protein
VNSGPFGLEIYFAERPGIPRPAAKPARQKCPGRGASAFGMVTGAGV